MASNRHAMNNRGGIRAHSGLAGTLLDSFGPLGRAVSLVSTLAGSSAMAVAGAAQDPPPHLTEPAAPVSPLAATPAGQRSPAAGGPASATAQAPAPPIVLPTVQVEGEAEGYRTEQSRVRRLATPLRDTPQVVAVVPEKVLDEQRATTVREALRNVSGITIGAGEGGRQGDTFILRGFSGQTDLFRDGSRDLGWYSRDTFNLEGVEVFFGPSSVLFGRGSTGGAVNLVTKSPRRGSFADVSLSGGTAPQGRIEADVNHSLSDEVKVRVNAMGQAGGVRGRDTIEKNRAGLAPSFRLELGRTTLELDYLYQRERGVPDYGQPFYEGVPVSSSPSMNVSRNTFYGVEDSDREEVDAHVASVRLQHELGRGARLSNGLRWGRVDRFALPTAPRNLAPVVNPTSVGRQRFESETDHEGVINQTDLRLDLVTAFLEHAANLGLELSWEKRTQGRYNLQVMGAMGTATNLAADLRNPEHKPDLSSLERVFSSWSRGTQLAAAVYASNQMKITKYLEVLGSLRLDSFGTNYELVNPLGQIRLDNRDLLVNWRGGLVGHPMAKTSLYFMAGTSSNPSAEAGTLSEATVSLDPERNVVYEGGAKADLPGDRLGLGASVFRIAKTNARVPGVDPMNGPPQILFGRQQVEGVIVGASGSPVDRLKLIASYTFLRSRIDRHTSPYLVGQRLPSTPPHSLALWSTCQVLANLVLGAGANFQAETVVNNPPSEMVVLNKVPDFWRLDAFASYAFPHVELQLNLSNLTDALYYQEYSGGQAVPAEGRVVLMTARVRL
jgi:catecholate siderophore receptor